MTAFDDADLVDRRAARLSVRLAAADAPPRAIAFPAERVAAAARRPALVRWRIAAALALLAAGALGVPPVRAWIAGTARALWSHVSGRAPARDAAPARRAGAESAGTVTFAAPADVFVLRVRARQAAGALMIETTGGSDATASPTGPVGGAELLVLPDGLRIANNPGDTVGYAVRLPGALARVIVQIAGEPPRLLRPSGPGQHWTFDLAVRSAGSRALKE